MKQFITGFASCALLAFVASAVAFPLNTAISDSYADLEPTELRIFLEAEMVDLVAADSNGVEKGKLRVQKSGTDIVGTLTGHMAEKGTTADCSSVSTSAFDSFIADRKANAETIWQLCKIKKP